VINQQSAICILQFEGGAHMADGYDRFDNEGGGGGSFVMGLLTGTVLGAGLGMLFAPKSGSELRNQVAEQAGNLANTASEGYRRASEAAGGWAEKGREAYDKARDAVNRGADEAQRYVREATSGPNSGNMGSTSPSSPGSGYTGTMGNQPGSTTPGGTRRS
jgi:gas vesicle protein